jgi:pectinesterase
LRNPTKTHRIAGVSALLLLVCCGGWPAGAKTITVAADGSGEFKTLQEAVAAAAEKSPERTVIHLKPGTYQGPLIVPRNKPRVTIQGDDADATIITYDRNVYEPIPPGVDKFNPAVQVVGDDFCAENVTFRNTSGDHGQALALRVDGDRAAFRNCRMLGWQDTLMVNNGRQYFNDCFIEGRVDFIYGSGTAVFDHCHVHSKNGGYVTAASTPQDHPHGFVFLNCKLTGDDIPWEGSPASQPAKPQKPNKLAYLGRPWRPYGSVTYLNCEMGDQIRPEGWHNWGKPENEKTARHAEYNSTGPGANPEKRVPWSRQLTREEAEKITVRTVLGSSDGWNPSDR